jgi:hypothetical protein
MLAKIFRKSRPINFIIISLLFALSFVGLVAQTYISGTNTSFLLSFPLLLLSLLLTDFIAKRNEINKGDSFAMLFFLMFLWLIPDIFSKIEIVASNFFVILAFRRLVSIHSLLVPKQKIFDAALWICVASVFEFWAILFIIPLYISIFLHVSGNFRNWLIPLVSVFTAFLLLFFYAFAFDMTILEYIQQKAYIDLTFNQNIPLMVGIFTAVALFLVFSQLLAYKTLLVKLQRVFKIIITFIVVSAIIYVISPEKNPTILLYCFAPLAMFGSDFMKRLPRIWMRESFLIVLFVISLVSFIGFINSL